MKQSEKQMMINAYKEQYKRYLVNESEMEGEILHGQKIMMKLFFY